MFATLLRPLKWLIKRIVDGGHSSTNNNTFNLHLKVSGGGITVEKDDMTDPPNSEEEELQFGGQSPLAISLAAKFNDKSIWEVTRTGKKKDGVK